MINNRNMLVASLLLLFLGATPVYADGAGIEGETLNQELLALCKTPEATPESVETLLKADANVTARNERGKTVIGYAKKNEMFTRPRRTGSSTTHYANSRQQDLSIDDLSNLQQSVIHFDGGGELEVVREFS